MKIYKIAALNVEFLNQDDINSSEINLQNADKARKELEKIGIEANKVLAQCKQLIDQFGMDDEVKKALEKAFREAITAGAMQTPSFQLLRRMGLIGGIGNILDANQFNELKITIIQNNEALQAEKAQPNVINNQ